MKKDIRKILGVILAAAVMVGALPFGAFAAKTEKVKFYGNSIPASAKQLCFVRESDSDFWAEYWAPGFKKYYFIPKDTVFDCKLAAEKFPKLQNLYIVNCDVKNTAYLAKMENLVWLGLCGNKGAEDISFLKKMTGLKKLQSLRLNSRGISDIEVLKELPKLKELSLDRGKVSGVTLSELTGLTSLSLSVTTVVGFDQITRLKNLRSLSLSGFEYMSAANRKTVSQMTWLEELSIIQMGLKNCDFLSNMTNLKRLDLDVNSINDISGLKDLTNLEELVLNYNYVQDISPLKKLTKLKCLSLCSYGGEYLALDLAPLKYLTELEFLGIYDYNVKNESALYKLTKLKELDLMGCGLDSEFEAHFRKYNPKCVVTLEWDFGDY